MFVQADLTPVPSFGALVDDGSDAYHFDITWNRDMFQCDMADLAFAVDILIDGEEVGLSYLPASGWQTNRICRIGFEADIYTGPVTFSYDGAVPGYLNEFRSTLNLPAADITNQSIGTIT